MINDNLGTLFQSDPSSPPAMALRQGVVQSWNTSTGENSVQVAGGTLVNIPALTGESVALAAGDVVALLTTGDHALVLGKVTTPGDPGTVPSWVGDITALAPLTDLAGVTTGLTITGTTNTTNTPGTGPRVVLNDPAYPGELVLYTDDPDEIEPARLKPIVTGGASYLRIIGPTTTGAGAPATADLASGVSGGTEFQVDADQQHFFATNLTLDGFTLLKLGDGTDYISIVGQAVTNANLSSLTNQFPTFPYYSAYLAAAATVNNNTSTPISWTDDATSPSSGITRSGSVFTVPTAGRYRVTFQAYWGAIASPAGSRIAQIFTGNTVGTGTVLASTAELPSAASNSVCLVTKTLRLAASAQFRTEVSHNQGATMTNGLLGVATGNLTFVQVEWVGP